MASSSNINGTMENYGEIQGILLDQIRENNSFGSVWTEHGIMHLSSPFLAGYSGVRWISGQHQVHRGQHQIGPKYYIVVWTWTAQMLDGKLSLFGLLEIKSNPNLLAGYFYQFESGLGYIKVPNSAANFSDAESMSFDATLVFLDDPEKIENENSTCFWAVKSLVRNEFRISSINHLNPQYAPESTMTEATAVTVNDPPETRPAEPEAPTHCRAIIMKVLHDRNYLVWVTKKKGVAIMEPWHREFYRDLHTPLGAEFSAIIQPYTGHVYRDICWEVVQLNHDFTVPVYRYRTVSANEIEIEMMANFHRVKQFPIGTALVRSKEKGTLALNDTVFDFERAEYNQQRFVEKFKESRQLKVWCRIKSWRLVIDRNEVNEQFLTIFSMSEKEESESARQRRKELTKMRLESNAQENANRNAHGPQTSCNKSRRSNRPSGQSESNQNGKNLLVPRPQTSTDGGSNQREIIRLSGETKSNRKETKNDGNEMHQTNYVRFDPWGRNNLLEDDNDEDYRGPSTSTGIRERR